MTRIETVVDSSAWIEYFRGTPEGARTRDSIEAGECGTPMLVLAELSDKYHRMRWPSWEADVKFVLSRSAILELTQEIAMRAGETKARLRKKAPDFGLVDAIIYETARSVGADLLTLDSHFAGLERVRYIGP
ncbi:MAG: PIN domain-containing protein [Euryarchaeota archaeon]|nr:PIN domain-containing protein [Euryarchaeota archaeon]